MVLLLRLHQSYFSLGTLCTSSTKGRHYQLFESRLSQPCQFAGVQTISAKVNRYGACNKACADVFTGYELANQTAYLDDMIRWTMDWLMKVCQLWASAGCIHHSCHRLFIGSPFEQYALCASRGW